MELEKNSTFYPLRVILTLSALGQMYAYASVILYSLWIGGIDVTYPAKIAFVSTIAILLCLSGKDVLMDFRNRGANLSKLGLSVYRLIGEIVLSVGLFYLAYTALGKPLSSVDLTGQDLQLRTIASFGVFSLLAFTVLVLFDFLNLRRKGALPKAIEGSQ